MPERSKTKFDPMGSVNMGLLSIVLFFLMQTYFRVDRIEAKQDIQGQMISEIRGYIHLNSDISSENLTNVFNTSDI